MAIHSLSTRPPTLTPLFYVRHPLADPPLHRHLRTQDHPSSPAANMSDSGPNGGSKGGKKGDDKQVIIKVAGIVVATGVAWGLYKTFSRPDHPLANTERGIKKDASNAYESSKSKSQDAKDAASYRANQTKGGIKDAAGNFVHKIEDVGHRVQGTFQRGAQVTEEKAQEGKDYVKDKADKAEGKFRAAKNDVEDKSWGAKKDAENKGWGAKSDAESKANEAKNAVANKADEAKHQSRGFWSRLKGDSDDTQDAVEDKSKSAKGSIEEKGREAKGALKDAGSSIKGFAQEKKEQVQDAGSHAYEKGAQAKRRIDGKQVTIQKGDTLWGLARKYNVSVESLKAANGVIVGDTLEAGDIITIPGSPPYNK